MRIRNHRVDNPRQMPIIPPFAGPVVSAQILSPLPWSPQNAVEMDSRYLSVASRGVQELGNLAGEGVRENVDKVWWARGRSMTPIGERPNAGQAGFMPSRPANNPNTKAVANGRALQPIRLVNPFDMPVPNPPTPQEFGDINFPNVGFFPRPGSLSRNR